MTQEILDQLVVPMPPYPVRRAVAVLAVSTDEQRAVEHAAAEQERRDREYAERAAPTESGLEPSPGENPEQLIRRADAALDVAGKAGEERIADAVAQAGPALAERIVPAQAAAKTRIGAAVGRGREKISDAPEIKPRAFETIAQEREYYTELRDKARAAGTPDSRLKDLVSKYEPAAPVAPTTAIVEPEKPVEKVPDFSGAQSFDELRDMLLSAGEIKGGDRTTYKANQLIGMITDARDALRKVNGDITKVQWIAKFITSTGGLRDTVRRLLAEEAVAPTKTPSMPEVLESVPTTEQKPELKSEPKPQEAAVSYPVRLEDKHRGGYIGGAVEWALRRTGAGAWLDTLLPRLESVYHRQLAEQRAYQQERARLRVDRATDKLETYRERMEYSSWPLREFYAWRMRAWDKALNVWVGRVNTHDAHRRRRIERHNTLQRQVRDRYERELEPYRAIGHALDADHSAVVTVIETLEG